MSAVDVKMTDEDEDVVFEVICTYFLSPLIAEAA